MRCLTCLGHPALGGRLGTRAPRSGAGGSQCTLADKGDREGSEVRPSSEVGHRAPLGNEVTCQGPYAPVLSHGSCLPGAGRGWHPGLDSSRRWLAQPGILMLMGTPKGTVGRAGLSFLTSSSFCPRTA